MSFKAAFAMGGKGGCNRNQFFGFSVQYRSFVSFLVELKVDLPHFWVDHRVGRPFLFASIRLIRH